MILSLDDHRIRRSPRWSPLWERFSVSVLNRKHRRSSPGTAVLRSTMVSFQNLLFWFHPSIFVNSGSYNLTVPNKQTRSASKTRLEQTKGDHIRIEAGDEENGGEEEAASPSPAPAAPSVQQTYAGPTTVEQTYDLPAPAAQQQQIVQQSTAVEQTSTSSSRCQTSIQQSSTTVQQTSVEQSSSSSVQQESLAIQQNAIQQSSTMHSSSSSQQQSSSCSVEQSIQQSSSQQSSSKVQSSLQQMSNQQSSSTQSVTQKQIVSQSAVQQQSSVQQTSVQQSIQQTIQQQSSQQQSIQQQSSQQQSIQQNGKQRSRQASGTQDRDAVVQSGGKFNITQGLNRRSRHQSGNCEQRQGTSATPGSALRGLDTALEKIAAQQKKEETHTGSTTYVAKVRKRSQKMRANHLFLQVSSRQSSRRQSVNATTGEEVQKHLGGEPIIVDGHPHCPVIICWLGLAHGQWPLSWSYPVEGYNGDPLSTTEPTRKPSNKSTRQRQWRRRFFIFLFIIKADMYPCQWPPKTWNSF